MAGAPDRVTWPPRLAGVEFAGGRPFRVDSFLPLASLTVLLGANGAGKSTTLRILSRHLPSLGFVSDPVDVDDEKTRCRFFVEVTDAQLDALIEDAIDL